MFEQATSKPQSTESSEGTAKSTADDDKREALRVRLSERFKELITKQTVVDAWTAPDSSPGAEGAQKRVFGRSTIGAT